MMRLDEDRLIEELRVVFNRRGRDPAGTPLSEVSLVGKRWAHYDVQERLGQGGMACVYRARDLNSARDVALKVLKREYQASPEICARFEREANSMSRIRHTNVVRIYDCPRDGASTGIAMELLTGGSLRDLRRTATEQKRRIGIDAITRFALDAARGLGAAHEVGIVHRDIKPANLLLDSEGVVKVGDFGVVAALEQATWLTGLGHAVGTPAYMSPEQCKGERVSPASDVYSLGVTMFELATGRLPFEEEGGSPFALMLKHLHEPAPNPRKLRKNLPHWLAWVILKCLDKNPAQRYPDGNTLAEAIVAGPHERDLADEESDEQKTAWRVNAVAIREQLKRLPQRAIVSWACRCARRVQHLNPDPRVEKSIAMAEATLTGGDAESQGSLTHALQRIQRLRTASLKAAYSGTDPAAQDASSHAALAAAATAACAAARCAADAAGDAAFVAQSAVTALELASRTVPGPDPIHSVPRVSASGPSVPRVSASGPEAVTTFWHSAQRDFQKLLAASLGPEGTIGQPIPESFWA